MNAPRIRVAVLGLVVIAGGPVACGPPTPVQRYHPMMGGSEPDGGSAGSGSTGDQTGDAGDQTGGAGGDTGSAGMGGAGGVGGRPPIGGSGGESGGSGSGGSAGGGMGGSGGTAGDGGTGGQSMPDAGEPDAAAIPDAAPPPPDMSAPTPDAGGSGGAGGGSGILVGADGKAICNSDPNVIAICKQLEPACENCPDMSIWNACFNVAAAGDDQACARYATRNNCKVDQGGNTCGSLNCSAKGCNRTACMTAQGNGDTTKCAPLLATCACK